MARLGLEAAEAAGVLTEGGQGVAERQDLDPGHLVNCVQGQAWVGTLADAPGNLEDTKHSGHRCAFCAQPSGTCPSPALPEQGLFGAV